MLPKTNTVVYLWRQQSVSGDTFERAEALLEAGADAIVIDTAHGHSAGVIRKLKKFVKRS